MTKIIQNAVYIPEGEVFLLAPPIPTETHSFVYEDGLALIIGGGLESAWRDGNGEGVFAKIAYAERYEEYALNDEYPIEIIRERLIWPDIGGSTGTLIKDLNDDTLFRLLEKITDWPTPYHREVVEYWFDQKEDDVGKL
jgi:hypothetical protein